MQCKLPSDNFKTTNYQNTVSNSMLGRGGLWNWSLEYERPVVGA